MSMPLRAEHSTVSCPLLVDHLWVLRVLYFVSFDFNPESFVISPEKSTTGIQKKDRENMGLLVYVQTT